MTVSDMKVRLRSDELSSLEIRCPFYNSSKKRSCVSGKLLKVFKKMIIIGESYFCGNFLSGHIRALKQSDCSLNTVLKKIFMKRKPRFGNNKMIYIVGMIIERNTDFFVI